jgi:hypothetical protein
VSTVLAALGTIIVWLLLVMLNLAVLAAAVWLVIIILKATGVISGAALLTHLLR